MKVVPDFAEPMVIGNLAPPGGFDPDPLDPKFDGMSSAQVRSRFFQIILERAYFSSVREICPHAR
jgi:hypothetical protein